MGSGCSVSKVRQRIGKNLSRAHARKIQMQRNKGLANSVKDLTIKEESEDELMDALSPMSAEMLNKGGSGGTRGVSASSTVLPGTSISFSPVLEELSEFESCKPLPDLDLFPEDIRHLLMGHCSAEEPEEYRQPRDVYLMVVTNDSDGCQFFEELTKATIPSLEEFSYENGTTLHVYLFGHETVESGNDCRKLTRNFIKDLLKTEIVISLTIFGRPNLHIQLPDVIQQPDFDAAVARMSSVDDRELIHCSYIADINAVETVYRLHSHTPTDESADFDEESVVRILEEAFEEKLKDKYLTSVFEDIIRIFHEHGNETLANHSILVHLETTSSEDPKPRRENVRVLHLLSEWENRIPDEHKFNFLKGDAFEELWNGDVPTGHPKDGGVFSGLESRMRSVLCSVFGRYGDERKYFGSLAGKGIPWHLRNELLHQQTEIRSHLESFRDRPDLLAGIMNYIAGPGAHPLVVRGRQGRGKSALLAVASVLCGAVFPTCPVLMRSAGASPESFTQEQILRSVCEQLALLYGEHPSVACRSIGEHNSFFSLLLRRACAERPLLIMLDGLDQVEEYSGRSLKWFPAELPPHVKLVVALREGSNELLDLQERLLGEESAFLEIPDLEIEETLSIIQHQLRQKDRRLTDTQLGFARICVTDNSYPRYAQVFAHIASSWHTLALPEQYWSKHSVFDIFCDHIKKISKTVNITEINRFLSTLATLKLGIMESEIFDVLNVSRESPTKFCPTLLIYLLHQLSFMLRVTFRQGHKFYHFKSQVFRKVCKIYLGKDFVSPSLVITLKYISNEENQLDNIQLVTNAIKTNHKHQRWRELEETTHLRIRLNISVRKYFFDHQWLLERVSSGDIYCLLEEIKMYKRRNPDDREIDTLRKFLQLSAYAVRLDSNQLYPQLHGRARGLFSDPESHFKYPNVKKVIRACVAPPVPTFHTAGPCLRTLVESQKVFPLSSLNKGSLDRISWLDKNSTFVVTYSSSRCEIAGWNAIQGKKMASFKIEECVVLGLESLNRNAEVLVLHQNTMDIADLTKGCVKGRMAELVDVSQGVRVLVDGKSVLAVSEGRDEILRFCTHSGHLKNRIAVGENRHLDCLLVSGNGRTCASGDAFHKPYTLLAWDIRSGVLLKEISIPHHEFFVRLSALSEDGKMLFATAKDLLDSSPTFLLVYDTSTGSVVWEMRPDSNICAVTLCPVTEMLIAATENGTLFGLNMLTGEKVFVVSDPSFRVNRILTARNKTFLSWDAAPQSRCLRVRNTITGQVIASYTADYNIHDCLFSQEGQYIGLLLHKKDKPGLLTLKV